MPEQRTQGMEISRFLSEAIPVVDNPELSELRHSAPALFRELQRMQMWRGRELCTQGERPAKEFGAPKLEKHEALRQVCF